MQLADAAASALPQFCRALEAALDAAAAVQPALPGLMVTSIAISTSGADDREEYYCSAQIAGESPVVSYVHLPDLDKPELLYKHFASDIGDWIAESKSGWGLKID